MYPTTLTDSAVADEKSSRILHHAALSRSDSSWLVNVYADSMVPQVDLWLEYWYLFVLQLIN